MTSICTRLLKALEWVESRDGIPIINAAEKSKSEYFKPNTEWTTWGDVKECYEHGFYAGAKYQRELKMPVGLALADVVEALEKMSPRHTPVCSSVKCHEKCLATMRKSVLAKLDEALKEME